MVSNSRNPTPCLQLSGAASRFLSLSLSFFFLLFFFFIKCGLYPAGCVGSDGRAQSDRREVVRAALHSGRTRHGIRSSATGSLLGSWTPKPGALAGAFNLQCRIVKVKKCLASSKCYRESSVCSVLIGWLASSLQLLASLELSQTVVINF